QNRLEYAMKGLAVGAENLQAAESLIRDTDMAAQMVEFVKDRILVQSSTAMLAQANTKPQTVLQLFR
ncbi:MAG: flagellin, partial [Spirochaetia bacterium]